MAGSALQALLSLLLDCAALLLLTAGAVTPRAPAGAAADASVLSQLCGSTASMHCKHAMRKTGGAATGPSWRRLLQLALACMLTFSKYRNCFRRLCHCNNKVAAMPHRKPARTDSTIQPPTGMPPSFWHSPCTAESSVCPIINGPALCEPGFARVFQQLSVQHAAKAMSAHNTAAALWVCWQGSMPAQDRNEVAQDTITDTHLSLQQYSGHGCNCYHKLQPVGSGHGLRHINELRLRISSSGWRYATKDHNQGHNSLQFNSKPRQPP